MITREGDSLSMHMEGVCMDPAGWWIVPFEMDPEEPRMDAVLDDD